MSTPPDPKPDKPDKSQKQAPTPAPTPGVVVTHKPNGIVVTNYTGAR